MVAILLRLYLLVCSCAFTSEALAEKEADGSLRGRGGRGGGGGIGWEELEGEEMGVGEEC